MVDKDRRGRTRNWVPGLFAGFWILLAAFSGAYLFRIVTDPTAHRTEGAFASSGAASNLASPDATAASAGRSGEPSPLSAEQAKALQQADAAKDKEIAELKTSLRELSGQVADLNQRFKPLEKVLGPVVALPTSTSVTTSPPSPEAMSPVTAPEPPKPEAKIAPPKEPAKPVEPVKATEKPPEPPKPIEKPVVQAKPAEKPPEPQKPVEKPAVQAKAPSVPAEHSDDSPEGPSESAADTPEERSISTDQPSPHSIATPGTKDQKPAGKPSAPVQVTANEPASGPGEASSDSPSTSAPLPIPPGTTRFGIEIGSVEKQDKIRPMWRDLLTNHAALVAGLQARRIIAPDKKWRLIAGPFSSAAEASQACTLFKKASMPCEATVFAGDAL